MTTMRILADVLFRNNDTVLLDCVHDWFFVDVTTKKIDSRVANCHFQAFDSDLSIAYCLRKGVPVLLQLDDLSSEDFQILGPEQIIVEMRLGATKEYLHFGALDRRGGNSIGVIRTSNMNLVNHWHLENDEYFGSIRNTFFGDCFLTSIDENPRGGTKLRSTVDGSLVFDFTLDCIPVGHLDRYLRPQQNENFSALEILLCNYNGSVFSRQVRDEFLWYVSASPTGKFYATGSRGGWSIHSSVDGSIICEGDGRSDIFFANANDIAIRLFGGGMNQRYEVLQIEDNKSMILDGGKTGGLFSNVVLSSDSSTLVFYSKMHHFTADIPEFKIVSVKL
jgi:hypothetical protein